MNIGMIRFRPETEMEVVVDFFTATLFLSLLTVVYACCIRQVYNKDDWSLVQECAQTAESMQDVKRTVMPNIIWEIYG